MIQRKEKLQVRMVTGHVVRVHFEAGRDGVNTTKVAVVEGFPLKKLVEEKRMKSEDDKKSGEAGAAVHFPPRVYASWRCGWEW